MNGVKVSIEFKNVQYMITKGRELKNDGSCQREMFEMVFIESSQLLVMVKS